MSPSPEHVEYAQVLLDRADEDLHPCRVLTETIGVGDNTVGFHAQQAVEKALKVALVLAEVELPRTHDLDLLVEKVQAAGIQVPSELEELAWPTPWAATLRYDEPLPLDRPAALTLAERACTWARDRLPRA